MVYQNNVWGSTKTDFPSQKSHVWFDRKSISIDALESRKSLSTSYELVNELIENELKDGIPINRIVVGMSLLFEN